VLLLCPSKVIIIIPKINNISPQKLDFSSSSNAHGVVVVGGVV